MVAGPSSQTTETVLAHELVHALQDQHDLLGGQKRTIDEKQVMWTRREGTANAIRQLYGERCGNQWKCWGDGQSQSPNWQYEARYNLLYFPYGRGAEFVIGEYQDGGWPAVNRLYQQPPASTEQIIYDTYPSDSSTKISLNDTNTGDWKRKRPIGSRLPSWLPGEQPVDYGRLGSAAIGMMFHNTAVDEYNNTSVVPPTITTQYNFSNRYVKGWEGDRLHVYQNDTGERGYAWKLQWESPAEAREFVTGYRRILAHWGGKRVGDGRWLIPNGPYADAFAIKRTGATVIVVNAPTVETLDNIRSTI